MLGKRLVGEVVGGGRGSGGRSWLSWLEALGNHVDCTNFQGRLEEKTEPLGLSLVVAVGWRGSSGWPAEGVAGSAVGAGWRRSGGWLWL